MTIYKSRLVFILFSNNGYKYYKKNYNVTIRNVLLETREKIHVAFRYSKEIDSHYLEDK